MASFVFNKISEVNNSGIKFGDSWSFDGYPEPQSESDSDEKYTKELERADRESALIEAAINKAVSQASVAEIKQSKSGD